MGPGSEGVRSHGGLGLGGLVVVVGLEGPLVVAQLHGTVGVREQVWEARCEIAHKVIREGPQCLLHLRRQLPVMVLLQEDRWTWKSAWPMVLTGERRPWKGSWELAGGPGLGFLGSSGRKFSWN